MTSAEQTVTTATSDGRTFETPVGADGKNPVTPNNPPAKALAPKEPKQPKETGIYDKKGPITPNNPANEKALGVLSEDHPGLSDTHVTDNSPNRISNPDAPSLEEVQGGDLKAEEFQYTETAAGTYVTEEGLIKSLPVGENAPEPDEKTGVVEGTPVSDHSSDSEPTANESDAERVAREQRETEEKAEADRLAAVEAAEKEKAEQDAAAKKEADEKAAADKEAAAAKKKAAAAKKAASSKKS